MFVVKYALVKPAIDSKLVRNIWMSMMDKALQL